MDRRAAFQARIAASAVRAELMPVTLSNGDEFLLRQLTRTEMTQVFSKAGTDPDCFDANVFVYSFRFTLVDEAGEPLCESFDEAAAFVNSLDLDDFVLLRDAVAAQMPAQLDGDEAVEAGKAY
jgi:hypothetical protein